MSGCIHDSGEITPKGRHILQHVLDNIAKNKRGHSVSWDYIGTVIDNAKTPAVQPDGRVVYIYKQPSRTDYFSIAVVENGDCVVTIFKDLKPSRLAAVGRANDWTGIGY